jgi:hypothetical protein
MKQGKEDRKKSKEMWKNEERKKELSKERNRIPHRRYLYFDVVVGLA